MKVTREKRIANGVYEITGGGRSFSVVMLWDEKANVPQWGIAETTDGRKFIIHIPFELCACRCAANGSKWGGEMTTFVEDSRTYRKPVTGIPNLFDYKVREIVAGEVFEVSHPDAIYTVDLREMTCDCPAFKRGLRHDRQGRCTCKHLWSLPALLDQEFNRLFEEGFDISTSANVVRKAEGTAGQ